LEFDLEMKDVFYIRDSVTILNNINLSFARGKSTAIIGQSGSGKTSLLKMAAGLIPPDGGKVRFKGKNIQNLSPRKEEAFRLIMGFCFQDSALWANKTIYDNMILPVRYHFPEKKQKDLMISSEKLLRSLGYRDLLNLRPSQLSAGERKIVSFGRSIVNNPELLFLDNPLLSVDPEAVDAITNHLMMMKEEGTTIIVTSHEPKFLAKFSDTIIIIDEGKIIANNNLNSIRKKDDKRANEILHRYFAAEGMYNDDILDLLDEKANPFA